MDVLVDILLSLLGRAGDALPFAPLREACEALFRAFAEQVTPQGFGDLVRVVQQAPAGQDDEEEDDDMFEEAEGADEEAAAGLPFTSPIKIAVEIAIPVKLDYLNRNIPAWSSQAYHPPH